MHLASDPYRTEPATRRSLGGRVFLVAMLVGFVGALGSVWLNRPKPLDIKPLFPGIQVTSQLQPRDILAFHGQFATLIDLRPDGEDSNQPSSTVVERFCKGEGIKFAYVPVPHGTIPDSAVRALAAALKANPKPVLLYCRSGKRAVRTCCLAEASRADGAPLESILSAAHNADQSADDLTDDLKSRIAHRPVPGKRSK